ncbi:hypothetical protein IZT72_01720 [Pseudomonas brenneri]|uniref:glycosyltransferase n=1 Tax=Pseudomonas fluorescens group TaxID=136843 RepID=UPI0005195849|nr:MULTISPECIES: glycosyltransferase [Pseudomonas fluorescens group]MBF8003296.1 hypothetical protein [Pseudomonas brenneri]WJM93985.1 glycosyltransferase [Pseudomonas brenneri]
MNSVSNHMTAQPRPFCAPNSLSPQPPSRPKREAPAPSESTESARTQGDRELAMAYHSALLLAANRERNVTINTIAPDSTFGQWWAQLKEAFHSPEVRQWIEDKGINTGSITLNPESGQISFKRQRHLDPEQKRFTVGQDDWQWAAISGPILQAGRVLSAGRADTTFTPPATDLDQPVPYELIGHFYKEQPNLTQPSMRQRAVEIDRNQGFTTLDPSTFASLIKSRSEDALQNQKAYLGDIYDRHQASAELRHLATSVEGGIEYAGQIKDELKKRMIDLSLDSTYQATTHPPSNRVSLLQFIEDHGWDIPDHHEQLVNLASALSTPTPKAPVNGNLGGALTWPAPLEQDSLEQLKADLRTGTLGAITLLPFNRVLDYLLDGRPISPEEQSNPRVLIDTLVNSPRGKALGQAIQGTFEARSVKGSAADWLLAALNVENDGRTSDQTKNQSHGEIQGYRLVSPDNTGKSPSTIIKELVNHLVAKGIASSSEKAAVQAHLLLANRAPAFLVKGIPNQVVVGTHSWVSLVTATARIEAKSPGATAAMSYTQIMLEAGVAPITDEERRVEYAAQNEAIKDWGVANGLSYPVDKVALNAVREAFNAQIRELKEASETQLPGMPTTQNIALEQLKKALPEMDPKLFTQKCITSKPSSRFFPGPYSILDMYIDGRGLRGTPDSADNWGEPGRHLIKSVTSGAVDLPPDGKPATWVASSEAININDVMTKLQKLPRPLDAFNETFAGYAKAVKKATSAQLKLLISKLPLEDRKNLEFGKLTIRKEIKYLRNDHPTRVEPGVLLVKTERNGNVMTYAIDRLKGTVTRQPNQNYKEYAPSSSFMSSSGGKRFDVVKPAGQYSPEITNENNAAQGVPNSFSSARTQYIVDAMITDMDLPAVERYAKGATTFDTEVPTYKILEEIALSLIPLRSAIKNFIEGKVSDGLIDLAFDIFGFAVGLGAAAKGAKAFAVGASALSKVGQVGKIIGRAAVGALNPLGGIDDLARGVVFVGRKALHGVKYLRGSYRSLNLLELAKKSDIAEGTYKATNSARESKTLAKFDEASNKWYAFDPRTKLAYGKPLDNFVVATPRLNDPDSLYTIGSNDAVKTASQQHGLAATGTFKIGQETIEGNVVMFQGNWHQYDALKKRAFGPPLSDFKPSRVAANGEVKSLHADLLDYEVKHIDPDELKIRGLQGNIYVGRSNKEYVKVNGKLYSSHLKEGQRVIRHARGAGPDIPIKDLGPSGWGLASRENRLLGGAGNAPTPWKLGDTTYVAPMDDIKAAAGSNPPYTLNYLGVDHTVIFDSSIGGWKAANISVGIENQGQNYFWRVGKNKWQRGTFKELKNAKKIDSHRFQFIDVSPSTITKIPIDARPLPKELHYFWAGQDVPTHLIENMANNAAKTSGYKSILHVDADTPAIFQQIKSKLEKKAPGLTIMDLNKDDVFKQLKQSELYDYFRQGQGKNLAAASDVARYPIMNKYGGIYLDTDDIIQSDIGNALLNAGSNDILLSKPVAHKLTEYRPFYNTSNFATQPGNPVITDIIAEMNERFSANKSYFAANRPVATRGPDGNVLYTSAFDAYEGKIFETVGPNLFNDILKRKRPDMYELGFDGITKESKIVDNKLVASGPTVNILATTRKFYTNKGIAPPDLLGLHIKAMKEHYLALSQKFNIKIGAEHSWINTR